jgi:DNA-binding MarR family transcriptional regulator
MAQTIKKAASKGPRRKLQATLTQADYERLAAFRHALRCFMEFSQSAARAAGLTPQQHQALLAIKGMPGKAGVTIGDLAGRLLVRHHSAVELVDRLEQKDLLRRDSDGQDGRRALLVLTEKGEAVLLELSASHLDELSRVGPELSERLSAFVPRGSAAV